MREDFVGNVERNLSSLESLLGKENVDDVKKRIADLIVNRVEDDLKHYDCYLFYPPDYSECINEAFSKVQKKFVKFTKMLCWK